MPAPFWSGKNAKVILFVDGSKVVLDVASWNVKQRSTKADDGVCGEERNRVQRIVDGYDVNLTCKQVSTTDLDVLLADVDNDDAAVLPLEKTVAFLIKPNDGTSHGYTSDGETVIDDWEWASGGRSERQTLTIPIRTQYFKEVPTL